MSEQLSPGLFTNSPKKVFFGRDKGKFYKLENSKAGLLDSLYGQASF